MDVENRMILRSPQPYISEERDWVAMRVEANRRATFEGWSHPFVSPASLARAGFFWVSDPNIPDMVCCFSCRGKAGLWEENDLPWAEHRKHFARCPFICGLPVQNVPIDVELSDVSGSDSGVSDDGMPDIIPNIPQHQDLPTPRINRRERNGNSVNNNRPLVAIRPTIRARRLSYEQAVTPVTITITARIIRRVPRWRRVAQRLCPTRKVKEPANRGVCTENCGENKDGESSMCEALRCKICLEERISAILLPCAHAYACSTCVSRLDKCCLCREPIKSTKKIYIN